MIGRIGICVWLIMASPLAFSVQSPQKSEHVNKGAPKVGEGLLALRALMDPIESYQGDFKQVILTKEQEVVQQSSGRFKIKRPGYFLWESKAPYEQTVVGTPQKLWVYDPDLEQVTIRKQVLNDANSPAKVLSGELEQLEQDFLVAVTQSEIKGAKVQTFSLTPRKTGAANYESVTVMFENKQLKTVMFTDKLLQTTTIELVDLELNVSMAPSDFHFEPPPGTDIISNDR